MHQKYGVDTHHHRYDDHVRETCLLQPHLLSAVRPFSAQLLFAVPRVSARQLACSRPRRLSRKKRGGIVASVTAHAHELYSTSSEPNGGIGRENEGERMLMELYPKKIRRAIKKNENVTTTAVVAPAVMYSSPPRPVAVSRVACSYS